MRIYSTTPLAQRFWAKVAVAGPDECWLWTGAMGPKGYGRISVGPGLGLAVASRASWELTNGRVPDGLFVLHRCDNPPCVNPAHLWLGTKGDNARDASQKGRSAFLAHPELHARGERCAHAKLTAATVRDIRRRYEAGGVSQARLAEEYGVGQPRISASVRRKTWGHVL